MTSVFTSSRFSDATATAENPPLRQTPRLKAAMTAGTLAAALLLAPGAHAATLSESDIASEVIASGLDHPWAVAFLGDGEVLVTERSGALRLIAGGRMSDPIAGVPDVVARGQGGLLDVALHPGFASNSRVYLSFSQAGDGGAGTAVGYGILERDGATARLDDFKVIFQQLPKVNAGQHYGSRLVFAPDGTLYVTLGERGQGAPAQDLGSHLGKVVRIGDDGALPADNPFANAESGARPEIWSYGHRNPQGAALHPQTGELWLVEHGARGGDEINKPEAGTNYGWPEISYGKHYSGGKIGVGTSAPGMAQPIHYWDPSIAPSGMTFYDGDLFPEWKGDILVGALKAQLLVRLDVEDGAVVGEDRLFAGKFGRIRDVRTGPDGAVYILTDASNGQLIRLVPSD
ncbi:PQQ-dependent sugar dehydrogenase [Methylobrevis pamukkalensis]|uniref:Soluble aldose sugar dehydrogenase YliI n=1 Tax=Methylobrevis pamukkalensis TaxID=1439726 RepID=A0A1E3GX10_9HYPH|nr:PQQ-dependent sugar dehydrogenase [Methylobrevis pamukkalensis]ODN68587.1 Soluble aldose sugar dehydrogenase YliI precursor [Methylobrevis pamukkalensis]